MIFRFWLDEPASDLTETVTEIYQWRKMIDATSDHNSDIALLAVRTWTYTHQVHACVAGCVFVFRASKNELYCVQVFVLDIFVASLQLTGDIIPFAWKWGGPWPLGLDTEQCDALTEWGAKQLTDENTYDSLLILSNKWTLRNLTFDVKRLLCFLLDSSKICSFSYISLSYTQNINSLIPNRLETNEIRLSRKKFGSMI